MATIYHQLAINAALEKAYAAIASADAIGTWWDRQTAVQLPDGLVLEHDPGPKHGVVRLKKSAAAAAEQESMPQSTGKPVRMTTVDFRQTGYDETSRFAGFNNFAWGQVLSNLKRVCESHGN